MKDKINKKMIKTNFLCGMILLSTGIILELSAGITTMFDKNKQGFTLNLVEIDTVYGKTIEEESKNQIDYSWGWPTSGNCHLTSYYSGRHPAIDIVTDDGDRNIYSASSGIVVTNTYKWDGGNYIIVKQDNGYYALYCHLEGRSPLNEGERVNKGQIIGTIGRTGLATGVHLHFSIWNGYPYYGGSSINPLNFY